MSIFRRMLGFDTPNDNLRIIITRHGERADFALGKQWYNRMQHNGGRDPRVSPLPSRVNPQEWTSDSPLTIDGENQSASVGKKLLHLGFPIDYCYSSPAFRSIQTATKILESQGRKNVPINIEPGRRLNGSFSLLQFICSLGLFECPAWYIRKPLSFIPPLQLARDRRFNINPRYVPMYDGVDPTEDERIYYRRSRHLIRDIIRTHKRTGGTVLLSGHGGSIEAVTRGLRGLRQRHGRPERLIEQALKVDYCNFAILERDARTRKWMVRLPDSTNDVYEVQLTMQSSIPLYGISTHPYATPGTQVSPPRHTGGHAHGRPHHHPPPKKFYPRYR